MRPGIFEFEREIWTSKPPGRMPCSYDVSIPSQGVSDLIEARIVRVKLCRGRAVAQNVHAEDIQIGANIFAIMRDCPI